MTLRARVKHLVTSTDGFIVSTEILIMVTIVVLALIVGILVVRIAVVDLYCDSAEGLANREEAFQFNEAGEATGIFFRRPVGGLMIDDTEPLGDGVEPFGDGTMKERPVIVPATPES